MTQWQPIETAPRDGRTILCFWPGFDESQISAGGAIVGVARWMRPGAGYIEHWCHEGEWTPWDPTHWMPLPEAPQ